MDQEVMTKEDFIKAQKALEAANVPITSPSEDKKVEEGDTQQELDYINANADKI